MRIFKGIEDIILIIGGDTAILTTTSDVRKMFAFKNTDWSSWKVLTYTAVITKIVRVCYFAKFRDQYVQSSFHKRDAFKTL